MELFLCNYVFEHLTVHGDSVHDLCTYICCFQRKSEDYYPEDVGCTITFGSHEIKVLAKKEYVDYEVRTMQLAKVGAALIC